MDVVVNEVSNTVEINAQLVNINTPADATTGGEDSINLIGTMELPIDKVVLTVRATEAATITLPNDAPGGTVVTVHVAEGWQHITFAPEVTVTGETDATETWVVLVRAEGAWQALVSGEAAPAPFDSGPRNISTILSGSFASGASVSRLIVQRAGTVVSLYGGLRILDQAGGTYIDLNSSAIPVGFRPTWNIYGSVVSLDPDLPPTSTFGINHNGWGWIECSVPGLTGTLDVNVNLTYFTADPEPETLPGVPV